MLSKYELFSSSVSCLYRDIQKIERIEMAKFGLKGPHAQVLLAMSRYPQGVTATELCEICEKDKAAISRTVSALVERGLVQRAGKGAYRAALRLTEEGHRMAEIVNRKVALAAQRTGEGLSDEARTFLYQSLEQISGNLKKISQEGLTL